MPDDNDPYFDKYDKANRPSLQQFMQQHQSALRQAGKSSTAELRHYAGQFAARQQLAVGLELDSLSDLLHQVRSSTVVVWVSKSRFTYAALYAGGRWYITGAGRWYGRNEFSHAEFVYDVLAHPEVTRISVTEGVIALYEKS